MTAIVPFIVIYIKNKHKRKRKKTMQSLRTFVEEKSRLAHGKLLSKICPPLLRDESVTLSE